MHTGTYNHIRRTVTLNFINTNKGMTVKQIAAATELSESTVRKYLHEMWTEIVGRKTSARSMSRDYPGFTTGSHIVMAYQPTPKVLTRIIRDMGSEEDVQSVVFNLPTHIGARG